MNVRKYRSCVEGMGKAQMENVSNLRVAFGPESARVNQPLAVHNALLVYIAPRIHVVLLAIGFTMQQLRELLFSRITLERTNNLPAP